jgi:hypothetical protein
MATFQTSNIFAALGDAKKKKKGSGKSKEGGGEKKKKVSKAERSAELERAIFDGPKISVSNWADTDEDSDAEQAASEGWGMVGTIPKTLVGCTTCICLITVA